MSQIHQYLGGSADSVGRPNYQPTTLRFTMFGAAFTIANPKPHQMKLVEALVHFFVDVADKGPFDNQKEQCTENIASFGLDSWISHNPSLLSPDDLLTLHDFIHRLMKAFVEPKGIVTTSPDTCVQAAPAALPAPNVQPDKGGKFYLPPSKPWQRPVELVVASPANIPHHIPALGNVRNKAQERAEKKKAAAAAAAAAAVPVAPSSGGSSSGSTPHSNDNRTWDIIQWSRQPDGNWRFSVKTVLRIEYERLAGDERELLQDAFEKYFAENGFVCKHLLLYLFGLTPAPCKRGDECHFDHSHTAEDIEYWMNS
jgi:hypothetical protein